MASVDDVKKLAALARLKLSDDEMTRFAKEFDGILSYISQLEQLKVSGSATGADISLNVAGKKPAVRNVFREDGEPHEAGKYTEALAAQFPEREGNHLSVKQIISYD